MQKMSEQNTVNGRRRFLKTAALAGGAASVAAAAGGAVAESTPHAESSTQGEAPTAKGYHVTPHIEAYYRLARQ
jgi:nitrous oxide reductase